MGLMMSEKTIKELPLQEVLDNFPCMIATIPTKVKTAFLCALAVSWQQDNWDYVPEHLIDDTLKMMPYMLDNHYGSDWAVELKSGEDEEVVRITNGVWTRKDVVNSYNQKAKYERPFWERVDYDYVAGCAICGKDCETVYEGEEKLLVGIRMCPKCGCEFVDGECYDGDEEEELSDEE
jgi:Pyruvate/2-oxoacid:ferredoxin oxidoreductase delta subunit